ncbi:TonB-dependent receptor [Luteimonas sp. BDR2-5]|uniref:TonB-dependent receptor n=1 Tax=Proluteimonas luteida TaxID=2878685 RepID=UPI001E4A006F|nr:TonB-dependent receptor [Luteimonas sp. BDR2-5]MCD9029125.1 TonB-dependent receptor [Luteimonas sp. BDR2-5]
MRPLRPLCTALLAAACSLALHAQAQAPRSPAAASPQPGALQGNALQIPAGDLATALDAYARQADVQLVYRADQLRGVRTAGVQGRLPPREALAQLLRGTGFDARHDGDNAVVIVQRPVLAQAGATTPVARPAAAPPPAAEPAPVTELQTLQVTGSRIPRAQVEGPAPITVMTAQDIAAGGFTSVPDVMQSLTQNGGQTQSEQSAGGSDFSPGAQQVDLRALGPNHTLVLVNGRRIADFPLPFGGRSNFTDISSLPLGMIERIEVLTGSASAIYGSDAIAGVVNFILKRQADGTTVDYRYGQTERGDAQSHRLNLSSGLSRGAFNIVGGLEYRRQDPLWGYERAQQDSTFDAPTTNSRLPSRTFLVTDWWDDYIDPGADTCAALGHLNEGSVQHAYRNRYGYYCGSDRSVAYRSVISRRDGLNAYASMQYRFDGGSEWFADVQLGRHEVSMFRGPRSWSLMTADGNEEGYFFNQATDQIEYWQRQFTREEMGGLGTGMVETVQKTFGVTTGLTGTLPGDWDYELALGHSQYKAEISWPQIVAARANALFLGEQLPGEHVFRGVAYPIFDAPHARLYTPLTRAEYDSIFARTTYHPQSESQTLALTLTQGELFTLPGGAAGFAATAELGHQSYDLRPDPLATEYYYYSWKDSDGKGSRNRWALAGELRMPLHETLNLSAAGRYDQYRFAGRDPGRFTWSTGVEWRPLDSLLVRGSYGTAFRAPDLHYVFAGPGNDETSVDDYYRCATEEPGESIDDCSYSREGIIRSRAGNRELNPETSDSWTAGTVWSPVPWFDVAVDYFSIDMRDQVQDLRVDEVMRWERDCRLGTADPASETCIDMVGRVTRLADGSLYGVHVDPINIARERTNGIDASANLRWETGIGTFRLAAGHTWVRTHEIQPYADVATEDAFAINSGHDIPRTKSSLRVSWENADWSASIQGRRLGRLPNDDSYYEIWSPDDGTDPWLPATYRYNANVQYRFNDHARLSLSVVNLFDKMPPYDATYTGYPYYDIAWFDTEGRSFYLQYTHKFGGAAL